MLTRSIILPNKLFFLGELFIELFERKLRGLVSKPARTS